MDDPLGFFLTWSTYGTWLPGDSRGWVEYKNGWRLPHLVLELESAARMKDDACRLTLAQRLAVERQIEETCRVRGWHLHAVNCRSNHVHVVLSAHGTKPKKIRLDLKAWTARRLRKQFVPNRRNWWAERGSIRYLYDESSLEAAIIYVREGQARKTQATPRLSDDPYNRNSKRTRGS